MTIQRFKLINDDTREHIIRQIRMAPWGKVVTIADPKKSRDQEAKYHAMFGDIAKQCRFMAQTWDAEDWKRLLVDAFHRATKDDPDYRDEWVKVMPRMVPSLDGSGVVALGAQTRRFTKKLASAFIEFLHAWGAHEGVRWSAAQWEFA